MTRDPSDGTRVRSVVLVWLLVSTVTAAPYVRASLNPPPGTSFVGFFFYVDDAYNYLSYAQQAEDGAFVFVNKLVTTPHEPALVNLEWWAVGALSRVMGRHPAAAYRVFGALAGLGLVWMIALWLRRAGLRGARVLPALLLVSTAGGLGGLRFLLWRTPPPRCPDLTTGAFPFIEMLGNPHFVAGTALLLAALFSFVGARAPRDHARSALLGTVLGLVRPYDLVLLVTARTLGVAVTRPTRAWLASLAPLFTLLPVVLYNGWIFYRVPAFSFLGRAPYVSPALGDLLLALGPALMLALPALRQVPVDPAESEARRHLGAWMCLGLVVVAAQPVHFSLQFVVGLGVPLLILAGLTLDRLPRIAILGAIGAMSTTALVAVLLVLSPNPRWYPPKGRLEVVQALRPHCAPGSLLLAPPDIGLYAIGLTACKAYVSHPVVPDYAERVAAVQGFYGSWTPAQRSAFLDAEGVSHVLLPAETPEMPEDWLGAGTPFRKLARSGPLSLYGRHGS